MARDVVFTDANNGVYLTKGKLQRVATGSGCAVPFGYSGHPSTSMLIPLRLVWDVNTDMKIKINSPNYIEEAGHFTGEGFAAYEEWLGCKVYRWCADECDNNTAVFETRSPGKSVIKGLHLEVREFVRTGKPIHVEITRGKKTVNIIYCL